MAFHRAAPLRLVSLVMLIGLAGCEVTGEQIFGEEPPACPPAPSADEAAYFSLEAGTLWRYAYEEKFIPFDSPTFQQTVGTLAWTLAQTACDGDVLQLHLEERFEGAEQELWYDGRLRSEQPLAWMRTVMARLDGPRLHIPGYTDRLPELEWIYPSTAPDTVKVSLLHTAGNGTSDETAVSLARGVGLVRWFDGQIGRVSNFRKMQLIED